MPGLPRIHRSIAPAERIRCSAGCRKVSRSPQGGSAQGQSGERHRFTYYEFVGEAEPLFSSGQLACGDLRYCSVPLSPTCLRPKVLPTKPTASLSKLHHSWIVMCHRLRRSFRLKGKIVNITVSQAEETSRCAGRSRSSIWLIHKPETHFDAHRVFKESVLCWDILWEAPESGRVMCGPREHVQSFPREKSASSPDERTTTRAQVGSDHVIKKTCLTIRWRGQNQ